MNRALREKTNRIMAILLSVILLLCLMGAGDISDALEFYVTTLQTTATDSAQLEWKEQDTNVLRCVPYLGNGLRVRNLTAGKTQGVRTRQVGYAFFVALFAILFKVIALSGCFLSFIGLYLKIYDLQTMIVSFLHEQDGKKHLIPIF